MEEGPWILRWNVKGGTRWWLWALAQAVLGSYKLGCCRWKPFGGFPPIPLPQWMGSKQRNPNTSSGWCHWRRAAGPEMARRSRNGNETESRRERSTSAGLCSKAFSNICFEWRWCPKCQDVLKDSWLFLDEIVLYLLLTSFIVVESLLWSVNMFWSCIKISQLTYSEGQQLSWLNDLESSTGCKQDVLKWTSTPFPCNGLFNKRLLGISTSENNLWSL